MNGKVGWVVAIVVAVVAVGYYFYPEFIKAPAIEQNTAQTYGTYSYQCDSGIKFTMTPSADISSLMLTATAPAPFSTVTLHKQGDGHVYMSDPNDAEFALSGNGETVTISLGAQTLVCNPVADPNNAPFNWGDVTP